MADGRQKYDTEDIELFSGLNADSAHKADFPPTAASYAKNFVMDNGSLENRKGYNRQNDSAYSGNVIFVIPYTDRDGNDYLLLGAD